MLSMRREVSATGAPESGHDGPVSCVDMRADGTLVSGGYDASLLIWSAAGRPERKLAGHRALVNGVRFSPDGARIASASSDHAARVWDAESGACIALLEGHRDDVNAVAWSPDGRCVATATEGEPAFACEDKIWAAIAMGELKASTAAGLGLAECKDARVLELLDTLSHGPPPFCRQYF